MSIAGSVRAAGLAVILSWGWKRALIALLAGAASSLAMEPFNAWPVLFITFPLAVWLIDGAGAGRLGGVPAAALTGWLFLQNLIDETTQTACWMVIFFFASAAASSAYLTVGETFPLEIRALAIAFFYAVGTGVGGVVAPWLFGALIETGSRTSVFGGYLMGAALMVLAGCVAWRWGVDAERKPLESIARPLTFLD